VPLSFALRKSNPLSTVYNPNHPPYNFQNRNKRKYMQIALLIMLSVLIAINLSNLYYLTKKKKTQPEMDMKLLHDLSMNGRALVEIKRIVPGSFFLRSPRD